VGQGLVVEMSPHDAMAADDVAYGRVPAGSRMPVVLAAASEPGSPWVERALRSDPLVELLKSPTADPDAAGIPAGALVVVDGACPARLSSTDVLVVNPPPGPCLGASVGSVVEAPSITSWSNADARFRFLTLDGVHVARARLLGADGPKAELVHAREGTLVADVSVPGRTGTLVGFDVGDSDWPFKASFVLFVRNVVELARAHRAHGVAASARAGEPVRLAVPPSIQKIEVTAPGGAPREVPARNGLAVVSDTGRAGVYHASWAGPHPQSVAFAVNLASERESDVRERKLDLGSSPGALVTSADKLTDAHTEWSWLLAALARALVVADVWYLTRRPRVHKLAEPLRPRVPDRRAA
jgi:hypothetical protein